MQILVGTYINRFWGSPIRIDALSNVKARKANFSSQIDHSPRKRFTSPVLRSHANDSKGKYLLSVEV